MKLSRIKFDIASARLAAQFTVRRFCFSRVRVGVDFFRLSFLTPLSDAFEHRVEFLFGQFAFQSPLDLLDVSAIRTLHGLFADVEFQVRAAGFAGEDSPFAAVKGLPHVTGADISAKDVQRTIGVSNALLFRHRR